MQTASFAAANYSMVLIFLLATNVQNGITGKKVGLYTVGRASDSQ